MEPITAEKARDMRYVALKEKRRAIKESPRVRLLPYRNERY